MSLKVYLAYLGLVASLYIPTIYAQGSAESKKLTTENAVFRVAQEVYFTSDIQLLIANIRLYRCLNGESVLIKYTGLDSQTETTLPSINSDAKGLRTYRYYLNKLLKFAKLNSFIGKSRVNLEEIVANNIILKCKSKFSGDIQEMERFLGAERFIHDRFVLNRQGKPQENFSVVKQSLDQFYKSVHKQIDHHVFY